MKTIGLFSLMILAIALILILLPFTIIYTLTEMFYKRKFIEGWKRLGVVFYKISVSIDQTGNVICASLFNAILLKTKGVHDFGDEDETVSSALGWNKHFDNLNTLGRWLDRLLHLFDPFHTEKSKE